MTPEEWVGRVEICTRPLGANERPPWGVTDHAAQGLAILKVIRAAVAERTAACKRIVLGADPFIGGEWAQNLAHEFDLLDADASGDLPC